MSLGAGIAIAGIWISVGICSFGMGDATVFVAAVAMLATIIVAN